MLNYRSSFTLTMRIASVHSNGKAFKCFHNYVIGALQSYFYARKSIPETFQAVQKTAFALNLSENRSEHCQS